MLVDEDGTGNYAAGGLSPSMFHFCHLCSLKGETASADRSFHVIAELNVPRAGSEGRVFDPKDGWSSIAFARLAIRGVSQQQVLELLRIKDPQKDFVFLVHFQHRPRGAAELEASAGRCFHKRVPYSGRSDWLQCRIHASVFRREGCSCDSSPSQRPVFALWAAAG